MQSLALKLVASPLLILAASLAGRRWGQSVAGWLVGLPLTSGPVVFFLALDHGPVFAAHAATGSLIGTASEAAFCLAYGHAARHFAWPGALSAATLAFAAAGILCGLAAPALPALVPLAVLALAAALYLLPPAEVAAIAITGRPRWDIPARMAMATALIVGLTAAAPRIGPRAAGLLATYPVFAIVLTVFAHRIDGEGGARRVLRGLLVGLFGFVGFYVVLAVALVPLGIAGAFALACVLALAIQGLSLRLIWRGEVLLPARSAD
jgi:hypothetical protein